MTMHAEEMREVGNDMLNIGHIAITDIQFKIVNVFVYEISRDEKNLMKRQKIDDLALSSTEWEQVKLFNDLLAVRR